MESDIKNTAMVLIGVDNTEMNLAMTTRSYEVIIVIRVMLGVIVIFGGFGGRLNFMGNSYLVSITQRAVTKLAMTISAKRMRMKKWR